MANRIHYTLVAVTGSVMACLAPAHAEPASKTPPALWAVTGVQPGDVLNMRDVPNGDSKILARIPPDARGLKHLGCLKNQIGLDQWMELSKEQRRDAQLEWCRVEFQGQQGWVAGRFLKKE